MLDSSCAACWSGRHWPPCTSLAHLRKHRRSSSGGRLAQSAAGGSAAAWMEAGALGWWAALEPCHGTLEGGWLLPALSMLLVELAVEFSSH